MTETVTIEKQVWESTLHRSMVLQAENDTLKDKIERLEKRLNIAIGVLSQYAEAPTRNLARCALDRIAEIEGDYSHYWEQQIKELENKNKIFTYMGNPVDALTYIEKKIEYERKELEK